MKKGFTIIEVMVAIFIITAGMLGAFSLIQRTIFFTVTNSSRITAAYLAQEGIEIVRNIRDSNWLEAGVPWDDLLDAGDYEVDYNDADLGPYHDRYLLRVDGVSVGFYSYDSGSPTRFKRKITIGKEDLSVSSGGIYDKMTVSVLVEWQERGTLRQIIVQENLYNWR